MEVLGGTGKSLKTTLQARPRTKKRSYSSLVLKRYPILSLPSFPYTTSHSGRMATDFLRKGGQPTIKLGLKCNLKGGKQKGQHVLIPPQNSVHFRFAVIAHQQRPDTSHSRTHGLT